MCGENRSTQFPNRPTNGPSPRVWGELVKFMSAPVWSRTIPTCVGRTAPRPHPGNAQPDHPHVCGENRLRCDDVQPCVGPSPRVWGELNKSKQADVTNRTIPTCVGRTLTSLLWVSLKPDHPHVCGENARNAVATSVDRGPSPRVWGELYPATSLPDPLRTIPTCVGRTTRARDDALPFTDHPHVCGENRSFALPHRHPFGPSPRVWGERSLHLSASSCSRTIPTCVGRTNSVRFISV